MAAAGDEVQSAYATEYRNHPDSIFFAVPAGSLPCQQIFFVKWEPQSDDEINFRQSLADMISIVIQNATAHQLMSVAFSVVGCEQYGYSIRFIAKTMVLEVKKRLIKQNLRWAIQFVVHPDQQAIFDEFSEQIATPNDGKVEVFFKFLLFNVLSPNFVYGWFLISKDKFRQHSSSFSEPT